MFLQKKQREYKLFPYMGSKQKYRDVLLPFVQKTDKKIYVEPFLGSGYLFLNVLKSFDEFHIADIDPNIRNMFYQFKSNKDMGIYDELYKKYYTDYAPNTYDGYYNLRGFYNENLLGHNTLEEAFVLVTLINGTINSIYRFGACGYNSGYGNRFFTEPKYRRFVETCKILSSMDDKIHIYESYEECITQNNNGSFQFIDPPYIQKEMANHRGFIQQDLEHLMSILDLDHNHIIYTDVKNELGEKLFTNSMELTRTTNISPNRKQEEVLEEMLYHNMC